MNKQIVAHTHSATVIQSQKGMEQLNIKQLHGQKHFFKEWNTNTYYSVDDSHKHHAKWNGPWYFNKLPVVPMGNRGPLN